MASNNPKMAGHAAQLQRHLENHAAESGAKQGMQSPVAHPLEPKTGAWAKAHKQSIAIDNNSTPIEGPNSMGGHASGSLGGGAMGGS